jgi:ribosomal protein S18 acetylase RimI-like enzyme
MAKGAFFKKRLVRGLLAGLLTALVIGAGFYWQSLRQPIVLYTGAPEQRAFIEKIFKDDWYLLVSERSDFELAFMLDNRISRKTDPDMPLHTMKLYKTPEGGYGAFAAYYHPYMHQQGHALFLFLVVDKDARGKGYGRALLAQALQELKKDGCTSVELAVREENTAAQALYKSFGFYEYTRDGGFLRMKRLLL